MMISSNVSELVRVETCVSVLATLHWHLKSDFIFILERLLICGLCCVQGDGSPALISVSELECMSATRPVSGMRSRLSAAFCALLVPTSCTLWPPTRLWSAVKELALRRRSASLCKPSLLTPDLGPESLSVSFWQSVWGSSLVKPPQKREDLFVIHSNQKKKKKNPAEASQYMRFVNLIKQQNVMESGEIKLSLPPRPHTHSWFDRN